MAELMKEQTDQYINKLKFDELSEIVEKRANH
jgi:hypothetical protein